jgi:uncharacterized membrane protein SirB2
MKNKSSITLFITSLLVFIFSLIVASPYSSGLCNRSDTACYDFFENNFYGVSNVLIFLSPIFFLIGLMSWVKNKSEKVFTAWWKIARIYIPTALILILLSPKTGGGLIIGMGGGFDREGTIWFTSGLFFLITFIMLPLKFWKYRKTK